jgi:hypothetical protein
MRDTLKLDIVNEASLSSTNDINLASLSLDVNAIELNPAANDVIDDCAKVPPMDGILLQNTHRYHLLSFQ